MMTWFYEVLNKRPNVKFDAALDSIYLDIWFAFTRRKYMVKIKTFQLKER